MKTKIAVILMAACSAIFSLLGAAGGMEYVNRRWDAAETARIAKDAAAEKQRANLIAERDSTDQSLLNQLFECRGQFLASTVLYEPAPGLSLNLSLGMRGLGVAPSASETPRWVIPAKIKPLVMAGTQGAVYYYMTVDNRMDGPYIPQVAPGQQ
jgi:hypothetical protein